MNGNKIAIIDMGTNTFHLLIARQIEGKVETILKEKISVKIGQNGISKGLISPDAYSRAVEALKHFTCLIIEHDVHDVWATATSAVRNARNGKELVAEIKKQTGIDVLVISGEKEAELIYYGVKSALKIGAQTSIIMDIGGGSVEFIICNDSSIFWKGSFEIGAQRLIDEFQKSDPISSEDTQNLKNYLDEKLYYLFEAARKFIPEVLIGSSGSFDTFCDIDLHSKGIRCTIEEEKEYTLP
ncbi:MAG TPA: exopolyphosphatase, partial [Cytophagaceae bacterium]